MEANRQLIIQNVSINEWNIFQEYIRKILLTPLILAPAPAKYKLQKSNILAPESTFICMYCYFPCINKGKKFDTMLKHHSFWKKSVGQVSTMLKYEFSQKSLEKGRLCQILLRLFAQPSTLHLPSLPAKNIVGIVYVGRHCMCFHRCYFPFNAQTLTLSIHELAIG